MLFGCQKAVRRASVQLAIRVRGSSTTDLKNACAAYGAVWSTTTRRSRPTVAIDTTSPSQSAMNYFFVRRSHHYTQQPMHRRHWLTCLVVSDVDRQLILAQNVRQAPWNDSAILPNLVTEAHQYTPVECALADAEFDLELNHRFFREQLHGKGIIPAKLFTSYKASGYRQQMRENFPRRRYRRRSRIASISTAIT